MKRKWHRKEEGFLSSFLIIFMVTLALMTAGAYVLVNSEGINMVNQIQLLQTGYAADSGIFYALRALRDTSFVDPTTMTVGNATVTLSTDTTAERIFLNVESNMSLVENNLQIEARVDSLPNIAIISTNDVSDINTQDGAGIDNENYLFANTDSIPPVDNTTLQSLSNSQGHDDLSGGTHTAIDGDPDGSFSFWNSPGVPNVTYITGDLFVQASSTIFGIYYVLGDVTLHWNNAQVQGVIYAPNESSDIYLYDGVSTPYVVGGIVTGGRVIGNWGSPNVQYNFNFMTAFGTFLNDPGCILAHVFEWNYQ